MNELLTSLLENPEALKEMIKEQVGQYKPLVYMIGTELLEVYKDFANNTEYFIVKAKVRKNQFDAYVEVGFTKEQAMMFLLADMDSMKKSISNVTNSVGNKSKKEK